MLHIVLSVQMSFDNIYTIKVTYYFNNFLSIYSFNSIQYSQRHSVINYCDRRITLLSDTDISFGLFSLFTYFDMPFG